MGGRLYTGYKFRDLLDWCITLLFDQCQILFLLTFTTETILFLRAARLFTVPYFFVRSFRYTTSYRHGILIFKGTEGAGVGDYSSEGGGGGREKFLASSQTAPAPYVVLTLMQDGSPSRKALDLDVLTEKWRTVNSLTSCKRWG